MSAADDDTSEEHSALGEAERPSDAEMIAAFRRGDPDAEANLYLAYREDALLAARNAAPDFDTAEDFVAEAFQRVFGLLRRGKGPTDSFRYYLRAAIRSIALDWYRARSRNITIADFEDFEPMIAETSELSMEQSIDTDLDTDGEVVIAFRNLSERWRTLLYYKVVEERSNSECGELMGLNSVAIATMYQRARDGLRKGYLTEVAKARSVGGDPACQSFAAALASTSVGDITLNKHKRLRQHVVNCQRCAANASELAQLAERFDKKPVALAIAGVAGSLVLPGLGTATRSSALAALLLGSPLVVAGIIALVIALTAGVVPLVVQAVTRGGDTGTQTIEIREPGNAAGGSCRVEFTINSAKAGRATLSTSHTGQDDCRLSAWLDGDEIVSPLNVSSTQVTVISRPGQLRVELSSGDRTETRTFTIPK